MRKSFLSSVLFLGSLLIRTHAPVLASFSYPYIEMSDKQYQICKAILQTSPDQNLTSRIEKILHTKKNEQGELGVFWGHFVLFGAITRHDFTFAQSFLQDLGKEKAVSKIPSLACVLHDVIKSPVTTEKKIQQMSFFLDCPKIPSIFLKNNQLDNEGWGLWSKAFSGNDLVLTRFLLENDSRFSQGIHGDAENFVVKLESNIRNSAQQLRFVFLMFPPFLGCQLLQRIMSSRFFVICAHTTEEGTKH